MALGPVSYTVVAFPGNKFNGDMAPEIEKLVAMGPYASSTWSSSGRTRPVTPSASSSTNSTSWRRSARSRARSVGS